MVKNIIINTQYIKLEQFFKLAQICQSGGEAKVLINDGKAMVNGEIETRRGRKLRDGDIVTFCGKEYIVRQDGG